jgi:prolyl-tRNA synthetase
MTVEKDEDQSGMAIRFKKEEDFSGWYTDVIPPCLLWSAS